MADYGFKVMKAGYDITNTDIRNLILSSKYTMLKYHSSSNVSLTITAGNTTGQVDVSHTLGYVPVYIAYRSAVTGLDTLQRILPHGRVPTDIICNGFSTSSFVRCRVNMTAQGSDKTIYFRVIIFKDKIV